MKNFTGLRIALDGKSVPFKYFMQLYFDESSVDRLIDWMTKENAPWGTPFMVPYTKQTVSDADILDLCRVLVSAGFSVAPCDTDWHNGIKIYKFPTERNRPFILGKKPGSGTNTMSVTYDVKGTHVNLYGLDIPNVSRCVVSDIKSPAGRSLSVDLSFALRDDAISYAPNTGIARKEDAGEREHSTT